VAGDCPAAARLLPSSASLYKNTFVPIFTDHTFQKLKIGEILFNFSKNYTSDTAVSNLSISIHRIVPDTAVKKSSDENSDILGG
jgi:hypothetical protein